MTATEYLRQAQSLYESANFGHSLQRAVDGLAEFPDDASLTLLAGRCALELGLEDAQTRLERAVALAPQDSAALARAGFVLA